MRQKQLEDQFAIARTELDEARANAEQDRAERLRAKEEQERQREHQMASLNAAAQAAEEEDQRAQEQLQHMEDRRRFIAEVASQDRQKVEHAQSLLESYKDSAEPVQCSSTNITNLPRMANPPTMSESRILGVFRVDTQYQSS